MTYQLANKTKDSIEQKTNSSNNLEKWFRKQAPERVELLLGVRHTINLALGIVNCLSDSTSKLAMLVLFLLHQGLFLPPSAPQQGDTLQE